MDQAVSPARYADFIASLETVQSQPLWDRYHRITTRQPQTPTGAHLWSWATMEPLVQRAVDEVAMADAERRVLAMGEDHTRARSCGRAGGSKTISVNGFPGARVGRA